MAEITLARTEAEILRCYPVMAELRPHLSRENFLQQVQRQQREGFFLAFLESGGEVKSVAGYRLLENLAWGKFLYVDDLVTAERARSQGFGQQLLDWLVVEARAQGCAQFHLDSGVQRFGAHRFYLAQRMDITCHHFAMKL
ncbi:MAG: GNAT family N-acetyltransferase [Verrucomicrobia bacterium]|nr:GNAT family N-acetyltransferase [Verrucomicrobiota bacterium]